MRVVAIVQARMSSTRLPGKVLLDIAGAPMLDRVLARVRRARRVHQIVVATTREAVDDVLAAHCGRRSIPVVRGSKDDVLDRYREAAEQFPGDAIVRITSDCPLLSPEVVDRVVARFVEAAPGFDYVSNSLEPRTFPRGLDVEVIAPAALERASREDHNPGWREHVTPYLYRNPDRFRIGRVDADEDHSQLRWTVDTPADLRFARSVYAAFPNDGFEWTDVLALLASRPELVEINRGVPQKEIP